MGQYRGLRAHPLLASRMLRRLHLLSAARWIDAWTADSAVKIEWAEGPELSQVARSLIDPVVGLLDDGVLLRQRDRVDSNQEIYYSIDFQSSEASLILRRLD
jgi:hypothetical protein